jgi:hypothetical protein
MKYTGWCEDDFNVQGDAAPMKSALSTMPAKTEVSVARTVPGCL